MRGVRDAPSQGAVSLTVSVDFRVVVLFSQRQLMRPDLDWENLLVEFHSGFFAASRSETLTGH